MIQIKQMVHRKYESINIEGPSVSSDLLVMLHNCNKLNSVRYYLRHRKESIHHLVIAKLQEENHRT